VSTDTKVTSASLETWDATEADQEDPMSLSDCVPGNEPTVEAVDASDGVDARPPAGQHDEAILAVLRRSPRHAWHDLRHALRWFDQLGAGGERAYDYRFAVADPDRPLPLPYPTYHVVVERILELLDEVGAVQPIVDWPTWYERHHTSLPEEVAALSAADTVRLTTAIVRSERFADGVVATAIDQGVFGALVHRLLHWHLTER
jgi:hypothetical protein